MAQKLGEWSKAPAEATGLYRAMLLRSGKWEPADRPLQTSAPLVLPSLGAQVSSFPSSQFRHFSITPFLLSRFFSHRLPSSSVWKQMSVHKSRLLLRHQVLPAEVLLDPCRDSYLAVSPRACREQPRVGGRSGSKAGIPRRKKALSIGPDVP